MCVRITCRVIQITIVLQKLNTKNKIPEIDWSNKQKCCFCPFSTGVGSCEWFAWAVTFFHFNKFYVPRKKLNSLILFRGFIIKLFNLHDMELVALTSNHQNPQHHLSKIKATKSESYSTRPISSSIVAVRLLVPKQLRRNRLRILNLNSIKWEIHTVLTYYSQIVSETLRLAGSEVHTATVNTLIMSFYIL